MCEDTQESRVHASQGWKQNLNLVFDTRKNQEVIKLASNLENISLCDRNRTGDSVRRKTEVSRIFRAVRQSSESGSEYQRCLQCDTRRTLILSILDIQLSPWECDCNPLSWLVRAEWPYDKGLVWHIKVLPILPECSAMFQQRLSLPAWVAGGPRSLHKRRHAE